MCHPVKCKTCQRVSWVGCGLHVNQIFANVPVEKRCFCGFTEKQIEWAKQHPLERESMPKGWGCCIM